jgi:hypothetical protein
MIDLTIGVEIKLSGLLCCAPKLGGLLPIIAHQIKSEMAQRLASDLKQVGVAAEVQVYVVRAERFDLTHLSLAYALSITLNDPYQAAYANTVGLAQLGVVLARPFSDLPLFQDQVEASVRRQIIEAIKAQLPNDIIAGMSGIWLRAREVRLRVH